MQDPQFPRRSPIFVITSFLGLTLVFCAGDLRAILFGGFIFLFCLLAWIFVPVAPRRR